MKFNRFDKVVWCPDNAFTIQEDRGISGTVLLSKEIEGDIKIKVQWEDSILDWYHDERDKIFGCIKPMSKCSECRNRLMRLINGRCSNGGYNEV